MAAASRPAAVPAAAPLADIRAEIDALDDVLHDTLMRRAAVVARLAASRAKNGVSPLRPGREAQMLRRLLARHAGPLPASAVVRLWREILASSTALQGPFAVALHAADADHARLAQEHFGVLTPIRSHPTPSRALATVTAGEAAVAVLLLPREAEPVELAWWTSLDSPRLQVVARLPFWSAEGEPAAEALAVAPGAPDPSGDDRSLLRLESTAEFSRAQLGAALTAAGLPPRQLLLRRDDATLRALAEVDGALMADDPRLTALPVDRALPLGFYAAPVRGE